MNSQDNHTTGYQGSYRIQHEINVLNIVQRSSKTQDKDIRPILEVKDTDHVVFIQLLFM